jgi:Holliday junction resolvase RusA-like endonuclease
VIAFTVLGEPVPQGSSRAFYVPKLNRAVITNANPRTRIWRSSVSDAARSARGDALPLEGVGVEVLVEFYLPRPASAPKRVTVPAKKPDVDKLLRAILDGITDAGVWRDDAQVVRVVATKVFAAGAFDPRGVAGVPRAEVRVRTAQPRAPIEAQPSLLEARG